MAKIRRIIHAVEKPGSSGFDAQYWPILIAIAILFGFLMGSVLTLLNGIWLWFSLLAIPVLIVSTTIALRFVDDRRLKRSTQLSVIISLIVHLAMLLSAHHWQMFGNENSTDDQTSEQAKIQKKQSAIPIVFETQQWQQSQEKITPQPNEKKIEKEKSERKPELEKKETPTPVDKSQRKVTQNLNQRKQVSKTTPKQSTTLSKLSRSNLTSQPKSGSRVSLAKKNSPQPDPDKSKTQPTPLRSRTSTKPAQPNTLVREVKPTSQPIKSPKSPNSSVQPVTRRQNLNAQPKVQVAATGARSSRSSTKVLPNPNTTARTSEPKTSPSNTENKNANQTAAKPVLKPTETSITKSSPNRLAEQPNQEAPQQSIAQRQPVTDPLASRRPINQRNPKVAQAPSLRVRESTNLQTPSNIVSEAPRQVVQAPRKSSPLNPRATNTTITRQTNTSSSPTQVQINAPSQQTSQLTQSATRASRRPNESLPSVTPNATVDPNPRRSNTTAAQVASNSNVESPADTSSQTQVAKSEGQPRKTTLRKSTKGTAGVGQSQNVLSDSPTSAKPSMIASDSAVRRQTSRKTPADAAFNPSQASQVRRSLADRTSPSAEMKVDTSTNAKFAASDNPAKLNAQSSASQITSASNANEARVNASQGSSNLDTGATKLVSENSTGRASGGGQPDVDQEIRTASSARARNGQINNGSLAANLKAEVPVAPAESGGGRPSETTPDPNSTSLAKTVAGDGSQPVAGPTSAKTAGPTEEASSAPNVASNLMARAALNETAEGDVLPGGGDPDPANQVRRTRSQVAGATANTKVTFSGKNFSSVEEGKDGTQKDSVARLVGSNDASIDGRSSSERGTTGKSFSGSPGGEGNQKSTPSAPGSGLARQQKSQGQGMGDAGESVAMAGVKRTTRASVTGSAGPQGIAKVVMPAGNGDSEIGPEPASGDTNLAGMVGEGVAGLERREATGGQTVELDVDSGPGGLGKEIAAETGINSRRARNDSTSIQLEINTRFQRKDAAGDPKINTNAVFSQGAFKKRNDGTPSGGGPSTEPSIELGLAWLAKQQRAPGNWSLASNGVSREENDRVIYDTPTAATGLALLAFQGAGYNHKEYRYVETVNRGVQWLVNNQKENGDLFVETNENSNAVCRLYSHGIAAIALCEAYGMTNDPDIKKSAQKSLDFIVASQDKISGGWRYIPGTDSDTSVTGWMVMAMKSGRLAGLDVAPESFKLVNRWLEFAADRKVGHRFRYNPNATNTTDYPDREVKGKTPTACMSAVGLLLRLYSGWNREDPRMVQGAAELLNRMPGENSMEERNTYYWYYATQVLRHVGGEPWQKWYDQTLYPLLIGTQTKKGPMAGSWDPMLPVPDRWGYFSGRLYLTTMNLLTLEVKWRLLPLYDETVK
ncbi:hypothetical protein OAG51_00295 [Pirellulaceae bacterium]|nr:hypothetical protein [Pirellulaceae bacterium]